MAIQSNHTPAFQKILVPLDGSILAEEAISLAADIARKTGGTLILLHVVLPSSCVPIQPLESLEVVEKLEAAAMQNASVYMQHVISTEHLDTLNVQTVAQVGGAPKTIVDFAQTYQVDLIVMRSHGETGFKRWFLGSVAQQVLRHSPVPVLMVREKYTSTRHSTHSPRMLVALDGTDFAETALIPAAQLCAALALPEQGSIHLMTAVRRTELLDGRDKAKVEQMDQEARANAQAYLNKIEQHFSHRDLADLHLRVTMSVVTYTDILEIVKRIIEESNCIGDVPGYSGCDFIAMATHKRHSFQLMLLGSYTEDVFDATRQPLLIIHTSGPQEKVLEGHRDTATAGL